MTDTLQEIPDERKRARKWRRYAAIVGVAGGIICKLLASEYSTICQIAVSACGAF
jgi:hypothetical protein